LPPTETSQSPAAPASASSVTCAFLVQLFALRYRAHSVLIRCTTPAKNPQP
jgi:hypothetical protein